MPKLDYHILNDWTREELVELNREVLKWVKLIDDLKRFAANSAFYPGDKVSWNDKEGLLHLGRVLRVNTKSISVQEDDDDDDGIWRISATLLKKMDD